MRKANKSLICTGMTPSDMSLDENVLAYNSCCNEFKYWSLLFARDLALLFVFG